jgi:Secretion system C-terminal sorting domain/FG-GAP repeat
MIKPLTLLVVTFFCLSSAFAQNWYQKGLDIDGEAAYDNSGSVSITPDGNTVAIGATGNSANGGSTGHVRVFTWDGSVWSQKGADINGEASGEGSGWSVSISSDGSSVAIGSLWNDGNGKNAGQVRVFTWNVSAWIQKGSDIDGEAAGDYAGTVSMSSDGNSLAIGAHGNDGNGTTSGHVRVFTWNRLTWVQKGSDIDGEAAGDFSGRSVCICSDGNTVAIGASLNDGNGEDAGHVRVFTWSGTSWTQKGVDLNGVNPADFFGRNLRMSSDGNTLVIGAFMNDGNGEDAGQVRVFTWSGTAWTQKGADIYGEAAGDRSGLSVSISSDGNILAVGAYLNDGNGNDAGHVRIYTWSDSAWAQKGLDIDGEATGDHFGRSVSMSSDGNTVSIGAPYNDGNGTDAGHVRVFRYGWPTGITSNDLSSVKVYPNPSSSSFTMNLGQIHQGIELKIMDVLGQIVSTKKVESATEIKFEITGRQGIYFVEISTNEGYLTTVKVIKE